MTSKPPIPFSVLVESGSITGPDDSDLSWDDHYHKYGWTVVQLGPTENREQWLEGLTNEFNHHFPPTEQKERIAQYSDSHTFAGLIMYNFGHTKMQYSIRELAAPYYSKLYDCPEEDLLVSYDGGGYLAGSKAPVGDGFADWLHHDHPTQTTTGEPAYTMDKLPIQGLFTLNECGFHDAGLVLMDSREVFEDVMERNPIYRHSTRVSIDDLAISKLPFVKITAPAGSLILWNALCFHQNASARRPTESFIPKDRRVLYVSFQPRSWATKEEVLKHQQDYENGHQTSHHVFGPYCKTTHLRTHAPPLHPLREIAPLTGISRRWVGYES